jgi:hypothetical protein
MDFFEQVKLLVKKNTPYTLRSFIELLNINYETYYSGKRRKTLPRADEAIDIARALNVSVEYLVTGEDDFTTAERDLLQAFNNLDEQGQIAAIGAVKALAASFPAGSSSSRPDDSKTKHQTQKKAQ